MNWKFDIIDLIVAVIVGFMAGFAVRTALPTPTLSEPNSGAVQVTFPKMYRIKPSRFTNGTAPGFLSPSSEASAGAGLKVGPESGPNDFNAGEANCPTENQYSLSGQLIRKAAERNGCYGDDFLILLAVRKAENGGLGKEFGVKGKAWDTDLETQAAWAAATIVKTRERFERTRMSTDFLTYLARRYCPLDSKTWESNVRFWFRRLKCEL